MRSVRTTRPPFLRPIRSSGTLSTLLHATHRKGPPPSANRRAATLLFARHARLETTVGSPPDRLVVNSPPVSA